MKQRSLPTFVRTRSRTLGPKPALVLVAGGEDRTWTWSDTWGNARSLALALLDEGIDEGEPVVLWADDEPEALFAEVGLQATGAHAVRLPAAIDPGGVAAVAAAVGARKLLAFGVDPDALADTLRALPALRSRILAPALPAAPGAEGRLDPWSDDPRLDERLDRGGPDSLALALLPADRPDPARGFALNQRNLLGIGEAVAAALGAGEEDTWWVAGPWRGAFARTAGVAAAWLSGGELVLARGIDDPVQALWRARPSIAVLPVGAAATLAHRAAEEVERGEGTAGRLSRWAFHQALHDGPRGVLNRGMAALAGATGSSTLRDVLGGRLTRVVVDGGKLEPASIRILVALGVTLFAATGNNATAGVATLERLPPESPYAPLVPGTMARGEKDGQVSVHGVSAAPPLRVMNAPNPTPADRFYPTGLKGHVDGDRVAWESEDP